MIRDNLERQAREDRENERRIADGLASLHLLALHFGSMPFRVERNDLISPWPGRTDERADA